MPAGSSTNSRAAGWSRRGDNGITQRLTKPRSPTTTGKIERFHRTLREEFLDHMVPFESLAAAQEAIDGWVHAYNQQRPHQWLNMATPSACSGPTPPSAAMTSILNRWSPSRSCLSGSPNRPSCRRRAPRSSSRCGCLPVARSPWWRAGSESVSTRHWPTGR
ncbi:integrase core domain-containing protein [Streptomyces sp. NBC_00289]|uniref:integrase core domain-containing protein n=1 Tax=Streptomyces sp. NBC_00289 TaxID=2975703 RepID=UPI00352D48CE